tara:strand:- start:143 stop:556 length:414 start_codon:yes stop_codon:yes gene_type:complete
METDMAKLSKILERTEGMLVPGSHHVKKVSDGYDDYTKRSTSRGKGWYEHIDEYQNRWTMTSGGDGWWTLECYPNYTAGIEYPIAPDIPEEYTKKFTECPEFDTKTACLEEINTIMNALPLWDPKYEWRDLLVERLT